MSNSSVLGPLNLIKPESTEIIYKKDVACLMCDKLFNFPLEKDECLAHLYLDHRIVIGDVEDIALLDEYLLYWKEKMQDKPREEYCTTMLLDQLPDGTISKDEKYYLLSDVLPQDYELRLNLHTKRLERVLTQHQFERTDNNFKRGCLYCRDTVTPTRYDFLEHLFSKHFLQLGKPNNLVYISELIDLVEEKMEKLICLFCEKVFKDRPTLKEHMRKKGHKRINPDNKEYDKFFLVNYKQFKVATAANSNAKKKKYDLSAAKAAASRARSPPSKVFQTDDSDSDWSDWEGETQPIICLFCSHTNTDFDTIQSHLKAEHDFDFALLESFNFYQKIKIVNCIRRHMHLKQCIVCDHTSETTEEFQEHLRIAKHCSNILSCDKSKWDQPEFFFPTYEDDAILCYLEDTQDDDNRSLSEDSGAMVFSEDQNIAINLDAEELSLENVNKLFMKL